MTPCTPAQVDGTVAYDIVGSRPLDMIVDAAYVRARIGLASGRSAARVEGAHELASDDSRRSPTMSEGRGGAI